MSSLHRIFFTVCLAAATLCGAAKQPKAVKTSSPANGVKTPGVLIPFANLKSEAELSLAAPPSGLLFTESIAVTGPEGIHRFDARTNKPFEPSRDIKGVEKPCGGLLSAFSFVWTASCGSSSLVKFEMRPIRGTRSPGGRPPDAPKSEAPPTPPAAPVFIPTGMPTAGAALAASQDSVWLLADAKTSLQRIDPQENKIVAEIRLPVGCASILFAEGSLWAACPEESKLLRIDPRTNLVDKRIEVPGEPVSITAGESSIWVLCRKEGKIARVDPKTNKSIATIELAIPNANGALTFGEGSVWASVPGFPIMRIAPATDKVVQQFHGQGGGLIQFGLGSVWVASSDSNIVTRFDPKRIMATLAE